VPQHPPPPRRTQSCPSHQGTNDSTHHAISEPVCPSGRPSQGKIELPVSSCLFVQLTVSFAGFLML
jgi:hypothetical protein